MRDLSAHATIINCRVTEEDGFGPRCQFSKLSLQWTWQYREGKGVMPECSYLLLGQQGLLLHDFHSIDVPGGSLSYHMHISKVSTTYQASDFKVLCRRLELLQLGDGVGICKSWKNYSQVNKERSIPESLWKPKKEKSVLMSSAHCQKTFSHFLIIMNNYKSAQKCFSMFKLRASEIPKHSFHGSYNLHPVDLENRRIQIMLFFLVSEGCRAVCDQKCLSSLRPVHNGM